MPTKTNDTAQAAQAGDQASEPEGATGTPSEKSRIKRSILKDQLKQQLQEKSGERRKRKTAETRVAAAQHRPGRNDLQPRLETVTRPIGALHPSPDRARITSPEQLEKVIGSVSQFGLVLPLLIDRHDQIVSGHILWEAAKKLGFDAIECRIIDHLEEAEIEALSLALNRIAETGSWDLDRLRERMITIETGGIELTSTGFTLPEIDQIMIDPEPAEAESEDGEAEEEDEDRPPVSQLGDLFELGEHRLLCGDALEECSYQAVLADRKAQCVVSDAPYNCAIEDFVSGLGKHKHQDFQMACGEMDAASFTDFLQSYLAHCKAHSSSGAVIFACMDFRQIEKLLIAGEQVGLTRNNVAIWNKGSGGMTGSVYRSAYENIVVFCNGKAPATNNVALGRHGRDRTNVWSYPGANRRGSSAASQLASHPTAKPVELVEDALLDVTRRGELVLDPFMGSGTTLIAAERSGRIACGIELEPKYVDRTIRRWEELTGEEAVHAETGLTFAELSETRRQQEQD